VHEMQEPGYYAVKIEKQNLASGIYFCRLESDTFEQTAKFIIAQ
jgi:hypothetical protein